MLQAVVVLICAFSSAAYAQTQEDNPPIFNRDAIAYIADAVRIYAQEVEKAVPLKLIDPRALARELKTPEAMWQWVRENTELVPYRGTLRGANGVLEDRLGNSLDRAILLSTLLTGTGRTVRLARTELSTETAKNLFETTNNTRTELSEFNLPDARERLSTLLQKKPVDLNQVFTRLSVEEKKNTETEETGLKRYDVTSSALLKLALPIARGSREDRIEKEFAAAIEHLQNHWWIQLKQGDQWVDMDVTTSSIGESHAGPIQTYAPHAVPAEARHRVTIRLIIDVARATGVVPVTVLEKTIDASEAARAPLMLTHRPLEDFQVEELPKLIGSSSEAAEITKRLQHWLPVLSIGGKQFIEKSFSNTGEVESAENTRFKANQDTQLSGMTSKRALGGLTGLFRSLPSGTEGIHKEGKPTGEEGIVIGERLQYEIYVPGHTTERHERRIFHLSRYVSQSFDRQTLDIQAEQERAVALLGNQKIAVLVARPSKALLVRAVSAKTKALAENLIQWAKQKKPLINNPKHDALLANELMAYASMRWAFSSDQLFFSKPNIVAVWERVENRVGGWAGIMEMDIVENGLGVRNGINIDPFEARVLQGIADTVGESLAVGNLMQPINTAVMFERDLAQGRAWKPFKANMHLSVKIGENYKLLKRYEDSGFAIIAAPAEDPTKLRSWWRIDPNTGVTLGVSASGKGSSSVEWAIKAERFADVTTSLLCFFKTLRGILRNTTDVQAVQTTVVGVYCVAGTVIGAGGFFLKGEEAIIAGVMSLLFNIASDVYSEIADWDS